MMNKKWLLLGCITPLLGAASPGECDRACLGGVAESYLTAMQAHDPTKVPMASNVRYTENGVELPLPDGLWRTLESVGKYRLVVADPKESTVGFFTKGQENGAPVLFATRLKLANHQITEIETIGARLSATLGGSPLGMIGKDQLGDAPRPQFLTIQPANQRHTREQLTQIVNTYFTGIENNTGDKPPPFAPDCVRLENAVQTSGRPTAEGKEPGALNLSCSEAFKQGYYHEDTRMRNRRILAIDEERGIVYAGIFLDHDATVRSYQLKNGHTETVKNTGPWTWEAHEIFQINPAGQISQIEAVLLSVPYGMRPGWSTGVHLPSPAAQKDKFKEY